MFSKWIQRLMKARTLPSKDVEKEAGIDPSNGLDPMIDPSSRPIMPMHIAASPNTLQSSIRHSQENVDPNNREQVRRPDSVDTGISRLGFAQTRTCK